MEENTNNIVDTSQNEEVNTQNIFEDFENDLNLKDEINKAESVRKKDKIYYIKITTSVFKYINILLLLVILISWIYIYIQNDDEMLEKDFLNPFCSILLWENWAKLSQCWWVSSLNNKYSKLLEDENKEQYELLKPLLKQNYTNNNYLKSKEVSFIINETLNKINPITILEEFDRVRKKVLNKEFSVQCRDIVIKWDIMSLKCNSFSSWDEEIKILWWKPLFWSSISLAPAFYKNIDTEWTFRVIEKQTEFSSSPYISLDDFRYFTKITPFTMTLKYNNKQF